MPPAKSPPPAAAIADAPIIRFPALLYEDIGEDFAYVSSDPVGRGDVATCWHSGKHDAHAFARLFSAAPRKRYAALLCNSRITPT
jgi:hypothetical protein